MFKARTSRTLLTILGMSIGISAILFLVSFGYGLQRTLLEKITTSDALLTLDVSENRESEKILDQSAIDNLAEIDGAAKVSPFFQISAQGKIGDLAADLGIFGAQPDYFKLAGLSVAQGSSLKEDGREGVVITNTVAQIFGKDNAAELIGQEIAFVFAVPNYDEEKSETGQATTTAKSLEGKFKIIGAVESEDNVVYINSGALGGLNIQRFSGAKVKGKNQELLAGIRIKIEEMGFAVSAVSDTVDQANKVFSVVQLVLMLFGIIALTVSAIGMFNTMTIALMERTEEIGIMKSIGASNMNISLMFIMESAIMGFMGGLGGVVIGLVGGEIVNWTINLVAVHFGGQAVRFFYSPLWFIGAILIFASFVGLVTGLVPARRASNIDPLDALRYK